MTTISVIIATYNGGARIGRAVASVLAQDHPLQDIEIVIVDDGSTDDSPTLLAQLSADHPGNIVLVHQSNAGPAAARNRGMRIARGDVVAFLDDDDYWAPSKLRRQAALLSADPYCGLVYCDAHFVDDEGSELADYPRRLGLHRGDVRYPLYLNQFLIPSSVMMRRSCIETCGYFDETLPVGEDYEYFLRLSEHFHVDVVEDRLLYRVVRPGSLSRRSYALDARIDLRTLESFLARNPDLARRWPAEVRTRLSDYHLDFANRLLRDRKIREGMAQWLRGFAEYPRLRPLKPALGALLRGMRKTVVA